MRKLYMWKYEIFKLKQKVIRPASSLSTTERIRRRISHPIQEAAGCMHYKFHAPLGQFYCPPLASVALAAERLLARRKASTVGYCRPSKWPKKTKEKHPLNSLCPAASTMYTQSATLWTEKREPKLFLWTTIDGFHHRSKCARQSGSWTALLGK